MKQNFYQLLGVSPAANQSEIKKAYRKLSKVYHPDKNNGSKDSEEKFKILNEAFQTLNDEVKRNLYDIKLKAKQANAQKHYPKNPTKKFRNETFMQPVFIIVVIAFLFFLLNELIIGTSNNLKPLTND